ncbi:hypothetical protein MKK75_33945 [Methylobacterium sp. J-030]|uniref:hypothetical protein n=1 Tax=Methylobacterium sp. J-030 TaxID=2836627 RepID=UPI001FBA881D|nr:hypothetical protein [Methylobacterium sp. J-030]MCJ2073739.1 hypothetical protein [Methylobacterium sp. J-030]
MELPAEFREFTSQFYQDLLDDVSSLDEMIDTVLSPMKSQSDRQKLGIFIDTITRDDISDTELRKIWWSSPADIAFYDGAELPSGPIMVARTAWV